MSKALSEVDVGLCLRPDQGHNPCFILSWDVFPLRFPLDSFNTASVLVTVIYTTHNPIQDSTLKQPERFRIELWWKQLTGCLFGIGLFENACYQWIRVQLNIIKSMARTATQTFGYTSFQISKMTLNLCIFLTCVFLYFTGYFDVALLKLSISK